MVKAVVARMVMMWLLAAAAASLSCAPKYRDVDVIGDPGCDSMTIYVDEKVVCRMHLEKNEGRLVLAGSAPDERGPFGDLSPGDTISAPGQWEARAELVIPRRRVTMVLKSRVGEPIKVSIVPAEFNTVFVSARRHRAVWIGANDVP